MVELGDSAGLVFEALRELFLRNFEGHGPVEARVVRLLYLAHTSCANRREDFVGAEFVANRERHMSAAAKFSRSRRGVLLDDSASGSFCAPVRFCAVASLPDVEH